MSQINADISLRTNVKLIFHKNVGLLNSKNHNWDYNDINGSPSPDLYLIPHNLFPLNKFPQNLML